MELEVTQLPLILSHDPELDWLVALEPGAVCDGRPDDEFLPIDDSRAYTLRDEDGPVIGFVLNGFSEYDPAEHPDQFDGPRFDAPVLGLRDASVNEIVLSFRGTFGESPTIDVVLFDQATGEDDLHAAADLWLACISTGNMKGHYGLGYTLWELGRFREAYTHLRFYTEIAPHNSWAWCWFARAALSVGETDEAWSACQRAIELEDEGGFETNARELMADIG